MYYLKHTLLWFIYLCVALLLSNCITTENVDSLFDTKQVKCPSGYIVYCEGRFSDSLDCQCVPNNIFNYPF